jgi:hypothetical protein
MPCRIRIGMPQRIKAAVMSRTPEDRPPHMIAGTAPVFPDRKTAVVAIQLSSDDQTQRIRKE